MSVPRYTGTSLFVPWGMLGTPPYFCTVLRQADVAAACSLQKERAMQISGEFALRLSLG